MSPLDLSLPPKPPSPVQVSSAPLPSTPPNLHRPSRPPVSYSERPAPPSAPVFRKIPPWRNRTPSTPRFNDQPRPRAPTAYATPYVPPSTYHVSPANLSASAPTSPSPRPWLHRNQRQKTLAEQRSKRNGRKKQKRTKVTKPPHQPQEAMEIDQYSPGGYEPKKKATKYVADDPGLVTAVEDSVPANKPSDPMEEYAAECMRSNKTDFSDEEQSMLCRYLVEPQETQCEFVYYLAKNVSWKSRGSKLTYKLAHWIYTFDNNYALVAQLLAERLDDDDGDVFADEMMGLDEMDELMDCQTALDACKAGQDLSALLAQLQVH